MLRATQAVQLLGEYLTTDVMIRFGGHSSRFRDDERLQTQLRQTLAILQ